MSVLQDTLYRYLEDPTHRQHHDVAALAGTMHSAAHFVADWYYGQLVMDPRSVHPEVAEHLRAWHAAEVAKSRLVLGDDHMERSEA